jgi:hypothetical protein
MNKELRENVKDAIYLTSGENQSDYVNKLTENIMSLILDEVEYAGLESCLSEAIDLVEDIVKGDYTPDSFTTQPWRKAINNMTSIDSLRGSDD